MFAFGEGDQRYKMQQHPRMINRTLHEHFLSTGICFHLESTINPACLSLQWKTEERTDDSRNLQKSIPKLASM